MKTDSHVIEDVPVLELKNVVFRYFKDGKRNILDHTSFVIHKGISVITGASGSGKSTLAAVVSGLYPENGGYLASGDIFLYGQNLRRLNAQKRASYLTVLFQNPQLQFCMDTLRHEMEFCLENICVPQVEMSGRIKTVSAELHLDSLLDQSFQTLSGGEKQRAELGCLFLIGSKCILMDEPFANIDEDESWRLIDMITSMAKAGNDFVIIDHRMDYWLSMADEILILKEGGHILQRGITRENYQDYAALIRQEGLYFPGVSDYPQKEEEAADGQDAALSFRHLSVCRSSKKKSVHSWQKREKNEQNADDVLLKDVSAVFPKGKMSAVLGPSGAGKTTLFLSVLGVHAYTGEISLDGVSISAYKQKDLYRHIGIIFQNPANQFVAQKVKDEVLAGLAIWHPEMSDEKKEEWAGKMLKEYGLEHYFRFSPYMLSQGQQRRLAVLSVLAGGQQVLLLDEPTYGQDFRSTMAIMNQLSQKIKNDNLTVIMITHDRQLALAYADRIYEIENKALIQRR
nr:ABC transporter ATP-binding protein [Lactimicrobium massiliense]